MDKKVLLVKNTHMWHAANAMPKCRFARLMTSVKEECVVEYTDKDGVWSFPADVIEEGVCEYCMRRIQGTTWFTVTWTTLLEAS